MLGLWILDEEPFLFLQKLLDLGQVLDVLVPPEEVVVLIFLFVVHLEDVVVDLGEDEQVGEGEVVADEEGA